MIRVINLFILLWMLSSIYSFADNEGEAIKKQMWETEAFKPVEIPEKYTNASCVIMNRTLEYDIKSIFMYVQVNSTFHKRVKIQDKAGVEEYSTFSFTGDLEQGFYQKNKSGANIYAGFKVIKTDGREIEIDIKELLVTDEAIEGKLKTVLNKVSIPDLEVGDILDYYFAEKFFYNKDYEYGYVMIEPYVFYLSDVYPIISQNISIKSGSNCRINCRSMNGAPPLEILVDSKNSFAGKLVDNKRDALKKEKWVNHKLETPMLRVNLLYTRKPRKTGSYASFLSESGLYKDEITQDDLTVYVKHIVKGGYFGIDLVSKNIKKRKIKKNDDKVFRIFDEVKRFDLELIDRYKFLLGSGPYNSGDERIAAHFSYFLNKYKIPHSILLTTDKNDVRLSDLYSGIELKSLIRIDLDEPLYISNINPLTVLSDIDPKIAGNQAYAWQVYPKVKKNTLKPCTIPMQDHFANNSKTKVDVVLAFDSLVTQIEITQSLQKAMRHAAQYNLINKVEFFDEYESHFGKKEFTTLYTTRTRPSILKKEDEKIEDLRMEMARKREEYLKDYIKDDYNLVKEFKLTDFEIVEMGLFNKDNVFTYKIAGSVEDLISKVGRNYILDAGRLISTQVSLNEEEKKNRHYNIYMNNPKSFDNTIVINIPEGYRVKGLELFNADVKSSVGGFTSKAIQDGSKIIITTHKYYTTANSDKSLWNEFIPFIDAAFNMSQKQLLFEKM